MNDQTAFRRTASISAITAAFLMLASNIVTAVAVDFRLEFLAKPVALLTAGLEPSALGLFRLGEIMGVFGYSLLLIPLMLYLWSWLHPRSPRMATLYTVFGLFSIVLGVFEYTVRIGIWPPMMSAYPQATESQRQVLEIVFRAVTDFTFEGLYALGSILTGLWMLGIGLMLRVERRILGIATAIMGVAILLAGCGWLLRVEPLARLELLYIFEPFWVLWLGAIMLRRDEQSELALEPATAI